MQQIRVILNLCRSLPYDLAGFVAKIHAKKYENETLLCKFINENYAIINGNLGIAPCSYASITDNEYDEFDKITHPSIYDRSFPLQKPEKEISILNSDMEVILKGTFKSFLFSNPKYGNCLKIFSSNRESNIVFENGKISENNNDVTFTPNDDDFFDKYTVIIQDNKNYFLSI
jgi:hypothetical protein